MILGFIWGYYHDLFVSHERGISFLFYTLAFSLSYIPTFLAISDVQKRQDIEKRPRLLWTIALYFTWIFGASIYLAVFYGRGEKEPSRNN
jgi:hypothetical protein